MHSSIRLYESNTGMSVFICSQRSCPYCFCNLCRKATFNLKNAFSNLSSLKADAIYEAALLKVLHDIETINIKKLKS